MTRNNPHFSVPRAAGPLGYANLSCVQLEDSAKGPWAWPQGREQVQISPMKLSSALGGSSSGQDLLEAKNLAKPHKCTTYIKPTSAPLVKTGHMVIPRHWGAL